MATSSSYDFSQTRDQIITRSLRMVGAISRGETPGSSLINDGAVALNAMVKHWQGTGIHIWRTVEAALFLQADQVSYTLGAAATDHATESFTETTLSASASASAASVSLTSASGVTTGDYILVELDSGGFHGTTLTLSGTTATLGSALASAAASGNRVITYTTKLVRPLRILSARRYNFDSDIETPLEPFSREEYFDLPQKTSEATPTGFYYNRRGGANSTGLFYAWPQPTTMDDAIKMTVARPIQDFDAAGDSMDLPDECYQAVVFNLAVVLGPEYECPPVRFQEIKTQAAAYLAAITWNETELQTIQLVPDMR